MDGQIWSVTLRDKFRPTSSFTDAAQWTGAVAHELYGAGSLEQKAVEEGWAEVGISVS